VILYDGWCPLCVSSVKFVLRRDRDAVFSFASVDSSAAQALLESHEIDPAITSKVRSGDSVALIWHGRIFTGSEAAWRIGARLPFPWRALALLRLVPLRVRETAYRAAAGRRHETWGRLPACHVPDMSNRDRFL